LASTYESKRHYREAENTYTRALRVTEEQFGRTHPQFVNTLNNLGYFYLNTGRYQEAEAQFREGLAIAERGGPGFNDVLIRTLHALGKIHMKRNEDAQAEAALSRAIGIVRGSAGNRTEAADVLETYSRLLLDQARRMRVSLGSTIDVRDVK